MDIFNHDIEGKHFPFQREKQWYEGALGKIRFVHPISQKAGSGSAVLINETTVVTLAKNVFDI